ncbi:hypothetical protein LMxysn_0448 [Listeria monocytogenes]|nr:hypothetical protein LMxysn_0448 [Listeria monocytogenes]
MKGNLLDQKRRYPRNLFGGTVEQETMKKYKSKPTKPLLEFGEGLF